MYDVPEATGIGTVSDSPEASCCSGLCSGLSSARPDPGEQQPHLVSIPDSGCSKGLCGLCGERCCSFRPGLGAGPRASFLPRPASGSSAPACAHLDSLPTCLDTALRAGQAAPGCLPSPLAILRAFPDPCPPGQHCREPRLSSLGINEVSPSGAKLPERGSPPHSTLQALYVVTGEAWPLAPLSPAWVPRDGQAGLCGRQELQAP